MESTNQGVPLGGNPSPFSSWGDVGAPHMATLSLLGLTIGLPIWIFSTSVVQNTVTPEQLSKQLNDASVTPKLLLHLILPLLLPLHLMKLVKPKIKYLRRRRK